MRVLLATDGSPCSRRALEKTAVLADATRSEVMVLVVSGMLIMRPFRGADQDLLVPSNEEAAEILQEAFSFLKERGVISRTLHRMGIAPDIILAVAKEERADLIVVGSHGRTGLQRFLLGSVSEKVLAHAPCSVLVTRDLRAKRPEGPEFEALHHA